MRAPLLLAGGVAVAGVPHDLTGRLSDRAGTLRGAALVHAAAPRAVCYSTKPRPGEAGAFVMYDYGNLARRAANASTARSRPTAVNS